MSLLRLAKNCGVLTRILAPTRNASALITTELVSNPAAHNTIRTICHSPIRFCEANGGDENEEDTDPPKRRKYDKPGRDRSKKISVETSIEYLNSSAYRSTYGDNLVWHGYRRVWGGGHFAPPKTRKSCIRFGVVTVASPCPICRDEYLILDHRNLDLLKQFVSPHTGKVCCDFIFIDRLNSMVTMY